MSLTPGQLVQIAQTTYGCALLAELHYTGSIQRMTTWGGDLQIWGQTWKGIPHQMVAISTVQESERLEYPAIDITLALADPTMLALAIGTEKTYRGRLIRLYMAVMDDVFRLVDEPQLIWAGLMDQITMSTGDGGETAGAITLRSEQPGKDSRNAMSRRMTHAQQVKRYPDDTGLERMAKVAGAPQRWLSKKYQER